MDKVRIFFENIMQTQYINSIIVIIVSLFIYKVVAHFFNKREKSANSRVLRSKKGKTYYKLIKSIIRYVFLIITVLIVLQVNGVNVSSMLAGVGIISVIVGFAIQDALKDIIKGFDIVSDGYYQVGDVINYKEIEGKVISIGIKTTKVEELKTQNIISISNRNIEQVAVVSSNVYIEIPMPYDVNIKAAEKAVNTIVRMVKEAEFIEDCNYTGVNELADSSIRYQIKIVCNPTQKLQARRNALREILLGLEKSNIKVPFNQIDVHQK